MSGQQFDQQKALSILRRLKYSLQHYKKSPEEVFNYYNQPGGDDVLDFMEFSRLMIKMEPTLTQEEAGQLFYLFDSEGTGITKQKFEETLASVPLDTCTEQQKKMGELALTKIMTAMNIYSIDIPELFIAYDPESDLKMAFEDLERMLHKIDPKMTRDECVGAFLILDKNGDRSISYKEFKQQLQQAKNKPEEFMNQMMPPGYYGQPGMPQSAWGPPQGSQWGPPQGSQWGPPPQAPYGYAPQGMGPYSQMGGQPMGGMPPGAMSYQGPPMQGGYPQQQMGWNPQMQQGPGYPQQMPGPYQYGPGQGSQQGPYRQG